MPPWTEGCQAPVLAPPLAKANKIKNTLCHGADKKKIEIESKKIESFIGSAPVVCAFFPDYMHDYIAKSNPECLKKDSHESEIVLGLKNPCMPLSLKF